METNVDKDNSQNEFFFNKDGEVRMGNMHQHEELWVGYRSIWSKIKADFGSNYYYINKLIQSMVGDAFKMRSFPTIPGLGKNLNAWGMHSK